MPTRSVLPCMVLALAASASAWGRINAQPAAATPAPAASAVQMVAVEGEGAKYWPRWRGPSGQGVAADSGYPDTWSNTQNVLWRTQLPGRGHRRRSSGPIGSSSRRPTTTAGCRSGVQSRRWPRALGGRRARHAHRNASIRKTATRPRTPTTDGRLVFAFFGNKGVMAVDFAGSWRGTARSARSTTTSRPGRVAAALQGPPHRLSGPRRRAALSPRSTRRPAHAAGGRTARRQRGWSTPIAIRAGGRDEIIVCSYRAITPTTRTTAKCCGRRPTPTPKSSRRRWSAMASCSPLADARARLSRFAPADRVTSPLPTSRGRAPKGAPVRALAAALRRLAVHAERPWPASRRRSTRQVGNVLWQGRLGEVAQSGFSASPVAVDGKIFFTNEEGETFVVKAGKTFELLHVNRNEPVLASPAMVDGRWYFRTDGELLAIGR